ncbi:HD domain-containing protein [Candidatus Woesebacteria bacterium]|nr:HD domain-containing protein [Candidatus Woesebacteria bacterium]
MENTNLPIGLSLTPDAPPTHTFGEIHDMFSATLFGASLFRNIRYARYKPEAVSNEEWCRLLGADVNNLQHIFLTYGIARQFILHSQENGECLAQEEQRQLLLAAIVHDWGEAIVGDETYDKKNDSFEEREIEAGKFIIQAVFGNNNLPTNLMEDTFVNIAFDCTTKLGRMFNAIEMIGYLRTALRAVDESKKLTNEQIQQYPDLRQRLYWLVNNVLIQQIDQLVSYADQYSAVKLYLEEGSDRISEAFEIITDETFDFYPAEEREKKKQIFVQTQSSWQTFMKTQTPVVA